MVLWIPIVISLVTIGRRRLSMLRFTLLWTKFHFVPGQDSVRIPIQNDFDFTNLSSVKMAWSVREDENVLYSGTDSMYGYPHTVSDFKLQVEKLVTVRPGRTYYVVYIYR